MVFGALRIDATVCAERGATETPNLVPLLAGAKEQHGEGATVSLMCSDEPEVVAVLRKVVALSAASAVGSLWRAHRWYLSNRCVPFEAQWGYRKSTF